MKIISGIFFVSILSILLSGCGRTTIDPTYFEGYYGANWTISSNIVTAKREFVVRLGGDPDGGNQVDSAKHIVNIICPKTLSLSSSYEINVFHRIKHIALNSIAINLAYIKEAGSVLGANIDGVAVYHENKLSQNFDITETSDDRLSFNLANTYFLLSQTNGFKVYNLNGTIYRNITSGGSAIWKDNDEIYFHNDSSGKVNLHNIISKATSEINSTLNPEGYNASDNVLLQLVDNTLYSFDIDTSILSTRNIAYNYQTLNEHHFSPDGTKILLTKKGYYDYVSDEYSNIDSFGIYVYDLETDELIKVRD